MLPPANAPTPPLNFPPTRLRVRIRPYLLEKFSIALVGNECTHECAHGTLTSHTITSLAILCDFFQGLRQSSPELRLY